MTKFIYKSVIVTPKAMFSNKKFEEQLRERVNTRCSALGKQGYELVSTTCYNDNKFLLMFKKKVIVAKKVSKKKAK